MHQADIADHGQCKAPSQKCMQSMSVQEIQGTSYFIRASGSARLIKRSGSVTGKHLVHDV
jgi:hypothetical protein